MSRFFQECKVTPEMLKNAKIAATNIGVLNNSIRGGGGNLVGCIGELAFLYFFPTAISQNTYQHDVLYNGFTIECKTKDRTVAALPSHEASVANYNTKQQADYYAFLSAQRNEHNDKYFRVFFCGFMSKEEYFKDNEMRVKGTVDQSNGWDTPASCYNRYYRELHKSI